MADPQNPSRIRKTAEKKRPAQPAADPSAEGNTRASPVGDTDVPPVDEAGRLPSGAISAMSEADREKVKAESGRSTGTNRSQVDTLTMPATGPDQAEKALTGGLGSAGSPGGAGYAGEGTSGDGKPDEPAGESPVPHDWKMGRAPRETMSTEPAFMPEHRDHTVKWPSGDHVVSPAEMAQMIAEAAYFRAERRGFHSGYEIEDWLGAEAEIKARLREIEQASRVGTPGG